MSTKIVIIGAGGFAREVLDVFDACIKDGQDYDVLGYIVEPPYGSSGTLINNKPILGHFEWFDKHTKDVYAICAVGEPALRFRLVGLAQKKGVRFASIVHPSVVLTKWVSIGGGSVITAGCILTNKIDIGNHVHVNLNCTIGHDAILGDFATLAPSVNVAGNVTLSNGCYIGMNANIIEKVHIGEWSVIGAGSVIIKDIPANTTTVGVPGRVIKTREAGWYLR